MKSKLTKDTKVAMYMRVGRKEQASPKIPFEFTKEEVKVLRDALLNVPDSAELFEYLGNKLRDYKERYNVANRSTEKSQREVQQESNQNSH
jgi:hypothetical protein